MRKFKIISIILAPVLLFGVWLIVLSRDLTPRGKRLHPEPETAKQIEDDARQLTPGADGMVRYEKLNVKMLVEPDHPGLTAAVLRQLPSYRASLQRFAEEKDYFEILPDEKVRAKYIGMLAESIGATDQSKLNASYDNALKRVDQQIHFQSCAVRRVYLFDRAKFIKKLETGEHVDYFEYDGKTKSVTYSWSPLRARQNNETLDLPIFIALPPSFTSYDEVVKNSLEKQWRPLLEKAVVATHAWACYQFIDRVVSDALADHQKEFPPWFYAGLRHHLDIYLARDLLTEDEALMGFDMNVPRDPHAVKGVVVNLETWKPVGMDSIEDRVHTAAALQVFYRISKKYGSNLWVPALLKALPPKKVLSTQDIGAAVKTTCGFELGTL